jgi:TolA-binding protein
VKRKPRGDAPHTSSLVARVSPTAEPSGTPSAAPSATLDRDSARAEDAAYLAVVSLLRRERYAEARVQAKAYLLRFPNGFRRVEMLNVATSSEGDSNSR